jgi:L-malate glycosyltransferase
VNPVRVCFLIDRLSRAGTETQLLALIRAFDRSRVEPSLVLLDGEDELSRSLEPAECPVLRLGVKSFASRKAISAARILAGFLRRHQIDLLQAYFLDSIYFGVPVAKLAGVRRIIRVRNNLGYWVTWKHRLLNGLYSKLIDHTLTNSDQGRAALIADGVNARQIAVLENGVDVERFADAPPPSASRPMARIGAVANLRPIKSLDLLVRAAAEIVKRRPQVRFEVAGEGQQRAELERLITELSLGEHFRLIGPVHDVPGFLASLDIAVLCSRSEGMSNALLEYMAAGRAIVATRVGAAEKLIRDEREGLLILPNDVAALANAIERLLGDAAFARLLGTQARQRVVESFSRNSMCRRFEDWYLQLMSPNYSLPGA